jgi:hypothetical protein
MTTTHPRATASADPHALRTEIFHQAEAIADMRGVSTQTALREVYGGPPCARVYCGPPDECPESALEGVLFTAFYLTAALKSGVSWPVAKQTLAVARKHHR